MWLDESHEPIHSIGSDPLGRIPGYSGKRTSVVRQSVITFSSEVIAKALSKLPRRTDKLICSRRRIPQPARSPRRE